MLIKDNSDSRKKLLIFFCIYTVAIFFALLTWNHIAPLPFSNPHGIISKIAKLGYNPKNEYIRLLFALVLPSILLAVAYGINFFKIKSCITPVRLEEKNPFEGQENKASKLTLVLFFIYLLVFSFNLPTHAIGLRDKVDAFHEGECVAPVTFYQHGQVPYKDFVVIHGPFKDVLRGVVAFKLFGKSIGALRAFSSVLKLFLWISIGVCILALFKSNTFYSFLCINIMFILANIDRNQFMSISSRDIMIFSFVALVAFANENFFKTIPTRRLCAWSASLSFLAFFAFFYSLDRGVYLSAAWLVIASAVWFAFLRKKRQSSPFLLSSLFGIILGCLPTIVFVQGKVLPYLEYSFKGLPSYVDMATWAWIYDVNNPYTIFAIALLSFFVFFLTIHLIRCISTTKKFSSGIVLFLKNYLTELCMILISIFVFKNAHNAVAKSSIAAQIGIAYLTFTYIIIKYFFVKFKQNKILYSIVVIIIPALFTLLSTQYIIAHTKYEKYFPLKTTDDQLLDEDFKTAISFLKSNLDPKDTIYTTSSVGIWYYLLDKPSPTRFPLLNTAPTREYQRAIVRDLESAKPKFVIDSTFWTDTLFSVNITDMFPIVFEYLNKNYTPIKTIGKQSIFSRNNVQTQ
ncbi:MAG: hypothetical protein AB7D27_17790 [Desulfomicrobium sp.]